MNSNVYSTTKGWVLSKWNAIPGFTPRNGPLNPGEDAIFREQLKPLEIRLNMAHKELPDYRFKLRDIEKERNTLKPAILRVEAAIGIHKNVLEDLYGALEKLNSLIKYERTASAIEPIRNASQAELMSEISHNMLTDIKGIKDRIGAIEEHIRVARHHLDDLVAQSRALDQQSDVVKVKISDAKTTIENTSPDVHILKGMLSPLWKIPLEIWIEIFRYHLDTDMASFLHGKYTRDFPLVPLATPSTVCRHWREIICSEPSFWSTIYLCPSRYIPKEAHQILCDRLQKGREPLLIVSNLFQHVPYSWDVLLSNPSERQLNDQSPRNSNLVPNNVTIDRLYHVCLVLNDDGNLASARSHSMLPVGRANTLKVYIQTSMSWAVFPTILEGFRTIEKLDVCAREGTILSLNNLATILPSLRILRLDLRRMTNLDWASAINTNLIELHIYYDGNKQIRRLKRGLRLPRLKQLGVTYPSFDFLDSLEAPKLELLQLRGWQYNPSSAGYYPTVPTVFQSIAKIQLHSFHSTFSSRIVDSVKIMHNAASIFARLVSDMHALQSASFQSCNLDGPLLLNALKKRTGNTDSVLPHLETIIISECGGITRADCEVMQGLVPRVIVHV
jgi:hypothetical protein